VLSERLCLKKRLMFQPVMPESLSIQQAQKLVLHAQRLPSVKQTGPAIDATLAAIEHLGYIQIDTISVIQRAHHHTLWTRNPRYKPAQLDELVAEGKVFEYWSHAAAYLPMRDYRFSLPGKHAIASGRQEHWYKQNKPLMKSILKRITAEGPLKAKDFEGNGQKLGEWRSKPAKQALECLWIQGDLMIARREGFQKVYELTERVLPQDVDTHVPSPEEHVRFLIQRYLAVNGLTQVPQIVYQRKGLKPQVVATMAEMVASGEVVMVRCAGDDYYALPGSLAMLSKRLNHRKLKILSPFDNLLIQRKRMKALFGFDYLIECYLSEAKRQYGYFSLPILWDGKLVARMDCKADRKASLLHMYHLALEPELVKTDAFAAVLVKELTGFLRFNDCDRIRIHRVEPAGFKRVLKAAMKNVDL